MADDWLTEGPRGWDDGQPAKPPEQINEGGQELWRRVATDLLYALNEAMELPADVGELCNEQDARDAVRLLHAELSSLHAARGSES